MSFLVEHTNYSPRTNYLETARSSMDSCHWVVRANGTVKAVVLLRFGTNIELEESAESTEGTVALVKSAGFLSPEHGKRNLNR